MAIADRLSIKGFNGVAYGATLTVTSDDDTNGYVEISFDGPSDEGLPYPLAFSILVFDSSGVNVPLADAVITANNDGSARNGYLKIADGAVTFAVTATDTIHVIGLPARND